MRHRTLGGTGLKVSELGLGTWGLSGDGYLPVLEDEQDRVIERAHALGITLFETADSYAGGVMEERLGRLLAGKEGVLVVTKLGTDLTAVPPRKRFDEDFVKSAFEASRERLKRDPMDVVLLHNPSDAALQDGAAPRVLGELQSAGKLRAWGASVTTLEAARVAVDKGAQILSLPYNAFNSRTLKTLQDELKQKKTGVLAHSVLAYGLLSGQWAPDKTFSDKDHRAERWTADELRRRVRQLSALRPLVGGPVPTLRSAALRFVLANAAVGCSLLGPRSALQLDQLVREAGKKPYLSAAQLNGLNARLRGVGVQT